MTLEEHTQLMQEVYVSLSMLLEMHTIATKRIAEQEAIIKSQQEQISALLSKNTFAA
jgi:hypothetical protein